MCQESGAFPYFRPIFLFRWHPIEFRCAWNKISRRTEVCIRALKATAWRYLLLTTSPLLHRICAAVFAFCLLARKTSPGFSSTAPCLHPILRLRFFVFQRKLHRHAHWHTQHLPRNQGSAQLVRTSCARVTTRTVIFHAYFLRLAIQFRLSP